MGKTIKETWYSADQFGVRRHSASFDGEKLTLAGGIRVPPVSNFGHFFRDEGEARAYALACLRKAVENDRKCLRGMEKRLERLETQWQEAAAAGGGAGA